MIDIILHNFAASPFSEKIRLIFGIKQLSWKSVEIPMMLPKPDLMPLTGGYRKTPVMQIGADVYCDTQIIIRELERRFPGRSIFPAGKGLPYGFSFWSDRLFFMPTVALVFGAVGDALPEGFKKDRAEMSGGAFSTEAMKRAAPIMRDQWRAHASFVAAELADGRAYLRDDAPTILDVHAMMNFWFVKNAAPDLADRLLAEFPAVRQWLARLSAIGHGTVEEMDAKMALQIAKDATPEAKEAADEHDPRGLKPGDAVSVAADDYGKDAVEGALIFSSADEIAIRRSDPQVGEVAVHFPRAGFTVTKR